MEKFRRGRTTQRQYEIIVQFMEKNPRLITGKLDNSFTIKDRQQLWGELTLLLNSDGGGLIKNEEKWRKTWSDWKSSIKAKAASIKKHQQKTGGGPPNSDVLTSLEERVLSLIGWISVEGDTCIEESEIIDFNISNPEISTNQCKIIISEGNEDELNIISKQSEETVDNRCITNSDTKLKKRRKTSYIEETVLASKRFSMIQERNAAAQENIAIALEKIAAIKLKKLEVLEAFLEVEREKVKALKNIHL